MRAASPCTHLHVLRGSDEDTRDKSSSSSDVIQSRSGAPLQPFSYLLQAVRDGPTRFIGIRHKSGYRSGYQSLIPAPDAAQRHARSQRKSRTKAVQINGRTWPLFGSATDWREVVALSLSHRWQGKRLRSWRVCVGS